MEDEAVLIVNKNVPTGYSTTMRSWMKPEDVEYKPTETPEEKPTEIKSTNKRKARNGRT